jgi:hypothetical protein
MKQKKNAVYDLDESIISVKSSTIVKLNEQFSVYTMDGPIDFRTEIVCDFANIPEKYHEVCLNVLTSKYSNKVSFGRNPFSECKPIVKRKWWQFWKSEYFESKQKTYI